ncbi:TadE/TadG family type IV pilus assembly protein [Aliikangiella sp. IMCC44632]
MQPIKNYHFKQQQTGQGMFEILVVFPFLLLMIFSIIQWGYISRSKATLNTATEMAARAGALNHGSQGAIQRAFSHGMVPLFMQGNASASGMRSAALRSRLATRLNADIDILSPSDKVFKKFSKKIVYPLKNKKFKEIPNDNLMYRPSTEVTIDSKVKMTLQDANLLKIRVNWCEELVVPVVGDMFVEWASGFFNGALFVPSAAQIRCNAIGKAQGKPLLAMQSIATYRMQTPFRQ